MEVRAKEMQETLESKSFDIFVRRRRVLGYGVPFIGILKMRRFLYRTFLLDFLSSFIYFGKYRRRVRYIRVEYEIPDLKSSYSTLESENG